MSLLQPPSWNTPRVVRLSEVTRFEEGQFVNHHLFDGDGFYGRLLCFRRGQAVPRHRHEHVDECFDVLEGEGTFVLGDEEISAGPGVSIYVPAGTWHALRADRSDSWVLRETVHERVYARRALRLLGRAVLKRLPGIGQRWR